MSIPRAIPAAVNWMTSRKSTTPRSCGHCSKSAIRGTWDRNSFQPANRSPDYYRRYYCATWRKYHSCPMQMPDCETDAGYYSRYKLPILLKRFEPEARNPMSQSSRIYARPVDPLLTAAALVAVLLLLPAML